MKFNKDRTTYEDIHVDFLREKQAFDHKQAEYDQSCHTARQHIIKELLYFMFACDDHVTWQVNDCTTDANSIRCMVEAFMDTASMVQDAPCLFWHKLKNHQIGLSIENGRIVYEFRDD